MASVASKRSTSSQSGGTKVKFQSTDFTNANNENSTFNKLPSYSTEERNPFQDVEFLYSLLQKAAKEREELVKTIEEQKSTIQKLKLKTSLEEEAFRKVLGNERSKFDKRILRNRSMIQRRNELLCNWAQLATMMSLTDNSNVDLINLLDKTCKLIPAAKEASVASYFDIVSKEIHEKDRPVVGNILLEGIVEEVVEDQSIPDVSQEIGTFAASIKREDDSIYENDLIPAELTQGSILHSGEHSIHESMHSIHESSVHSFHESKLSSKVVDVKGESVNKLLFGNSLDGSLYDVSMGSGNKSSIKQDSRQNISNSTSIHQRSVKQEDSIREVKKILGIDGRPPLQSEADKGVDINDRGNGFTLIASTSPEKEILPYKFQPETSRELSKSKYWWDQLVDDQDKNDDEVTPLKSFQSPNKHAPASVVDNLILGSGLDSENDEDDVDDEKVEAAAEKQADQDQADHQESKKSSSKQKIKTISLHSEDLDISNST